MPSVAMFAALDSGNGDEGDMRGSEKEGEKVFGIKGARAL